MVLFTDGDYFTPEIMGRYFSDLLSIAEIRFTTARTSSELGVELRDVDVLVARRAEIRGDALAQAGKLRGIQSWGVGVETIDLDAATARRIPVANSPGNAPAVAEATFALLLAVSKNLLVWTEAARSGTVPGGQVRGTELLDKTIGVVGYGRIGRRVGEIASAFGMSVLVHDPYLEDPATATHVPLTELLATADVVSLHSVLTPETHHQIDRAALTLMKPSTILINTARGALVDELALIDALRNGEIAGAGLDVFETEPPDPANPLLRMPNVVATPHALPRTWESGARTSAMIVDGVKALLAGRLPANTLNPGARS